ncbi:Uncharacterized protein SCG7109_AK_00220 [Chlamydiales bacterium SCGC AG-110-M15]|nr:Uncharacterized protein SCG7109_AK_00220 [Chlamydiales bacterium SCGC AG-110-M15]
MTNHTQETHTHESFHKTRFAVIWMNILSEPLFTVYGLLAFILRKDLNASIFQIAILMMLRPVVSILSLYWSHTFGRRRDRLLSNVMTAEILSRAPFLLFPFTNNVWLIIACSAFHMMMRRGGVPAWMEILKLNLPSKERNRIFSQGSVVAYAEGVLLAIPIGYLLDSNPHMWRWLFPACALLGIASVALQARIPIPLEKLPMSFEPHGASIWKKILDPWVQSIQLLKSRPDFARFQAGFMICGFGLMLMQPALPLYFADVLNISYTDLMIALSVCRGMGYIISSGYWAQWLSKVGIFQFTSAVNVAVALSFCLMILAQFHIAGLYSAYFLYGIFLAGSHLSWNLSGPLFSHNEDSSVFTGVNIVTVGIRGSVGPALGGFLCVLLGPTSVFFIGIGFCTLAASKMAEWSKTATITTH